jgi:hypothetical protein
MHIAVKLVVRAFPFISTTGRSSHQSLFGLRDLKSSYNIALAVCLSSSCFWENLN